MNIAQSGVRPAPDATQASPQEQPQEPMLDTAGSCAIVLLLINDLCYIANLGDSRGVMSSMRGATVTALSTDHKPNEPSEYARIVKYGGTVYQ